jgi:UDP-2,3-diacylglucosamine pyrophosphatase LpxH
MISNENNLYILSTSETTQLAQFLTNVLLHFKYYQSSSEDAFLNNLHLVADCYRLILLHGDKNIVLDERIQVFRQYFELNILPVKTEKVALAIAEMINIISDQIRLLSLPWFEAAYQGAINDLLSDKWAYLHTSKQVEDLLRRKIRRNGPRRVG